jgi:lysozyme
MINQAGIDLIKKWEGFKADAYRDAVGIWTIGYGTTAMAGVGIDPKPGMRITEAQAEEYLRRGVEKFAREIRPHITAPINENEFAAFVSLAYNIGPGAFRKSSALRHFNQGNKAKAADAILLWNKAGGKVLRGLVNRRQDERALFLARPQTAPHSAPKPAKQPKPQLGLGAAVAALLAALAVGLSQAWEHIAQFFGG